MTTTSTETDAMFRTNSPDDVMDQRIVEQHLSDLAEHLSLALEAGDLGTWRWDMASGSVVWDERLERLFGLEPGQYDGSFEMYVSLVHPDERDELLETVGSAVEEKSSYRIDHRVVWPDGSVHWLHCRGNVTLDSHGVVTGTIGCAADITVAKVAAAEAERRALEADRSAERERQQRERLSFLASLTDASIRASDHREFMSVVTTAAVQRLGDWCALHFQPEPGSATEVEVAHSDPDRVAWAKDLSEWFFYDPAGRTGVAAVIRTGKVEYIESVDQDFIDDARARSKKDRDEAAASLEALSLTSLITAPLLTKRGVLGAIQFVSAESGHHFTDEDVSLARAVAGRIAEALDNMWLIDEHRNISVSLQEALLPPEVATVPGLDIAVRYWPAGAASQVGGDFYDVFAIGDTTWAVLIGDVCGTGPNAAAVTGIVRHTVRAAARHAQDHASVLNWINEAVLLSGRNRFCTACYATIEIVDGGYQLTCAAGGHPLPVVARADGSAATIGEPGTLLGVFEEVRCHTAETHIGPGDVLVFYTDGVSDLPPPHGLTSEQVTDLIAEVAHVGDANDIADAIDRSIKERIATNQRADDIALVVLRSDF